MSLSIAQKILNNNTFYTDKYLKDTINLTKSISIVNDREARLYNEFVQTKYPSIPFDPADKKTWRYYLHLSGQLHAVDLPVQLISVDNGDTITLTPTTLLLHRITHRELLKYDLLYDELVKKYPEQELYIKAVIATSPKLTQQTIIDSENFTIISYNQTLIEENEGDLIEHLQHRINNYKVNRLIQYYSISDNLFLASMYHVLYNFIFKTLLSLRLSNAKTLKAHSYHILNYLASHHYLDIHYNSLTKKQALFLYRNLLYLNNHSGQDNIFRLLIDRLFTERNITAVNYINSQENTVDDNHYTNYRFKQKLLNNANFVYSYRDYALDEVLTKEKPLAESNSKEIAFHTQEIDQSFKDTLHSTLLTKDIEAIVVDNTDTVKYKLIPMLVDYWAYLLHTNQMRFLVTVLDPVSNRELRINTHDLFKLYTVALYKRHNEDITEFPTYTVQRVFKPVIPSTKELQRYFYKHKTYHKEYIEKIRHAVIPYAETITSYQFEQFLTSVYKLNIGLWLFINNLHDKDDIGQFDNLVSNLHQAHQFTFNDETVETFLNRINMAHIKDYTNASLDSMIYAILNNVFDNRLGFLSKYKAIQSSMIEVFKKFNSYTVQIINNYTQPSTILLGDYEPKPTIDKDENYQEVVADVHLSSIEAFDRSRYVKSVAFIDRIDTEEVQHSFNNVPVIPVFEFKERHVERVSVVFNTFTVNGLDTSDWVVTKSSDDDLMFLALNA